MKRIFSIRTIITLLVITTSASSFSSLVQIRDVDLKNASQYIDEGSYLKALRIYKNIETELATLDNVQKSQIFNNMGFCSYKLKMIDDAESYYRRALLINNQYVFCLNNLGVLFMNRRKYDEALEMLERAYEIDKKNIKVIINLAVCYGSLREEEKAISYLAAAFVIDENYTRLRLKKHHYSEQDIQKVEEYVRSKKVGDGKNN